MFNNYPKSDLETYFSHFSTCMIIPRLYQFFSIPSTFSFSTTLAGLYLLISMFVHSVSGDYSRPGQQFPPRAAP